MKWLIFALGIAFIFSVTVALAEAPPSLTNFQQFYGEMQNLPAGNYWLNVTTGDTRYIISFDAQHRYGYSPLLKVFGSAGVPVEFYLINASRRQSLLQSVAYESGAVTLLNFDYGAPSGSGGTTTSSGGTSSSSSSGSSGGSTANNTTPPTGSCLYNWQCSLWSDCVDNLETRTCRRTDNCDQSYEQRKVARVVVLEKPTERRACTSPASPPPPSPPPSPTVCTDGTRRCSGEQLLQCDGLKWNAVQSCPEGCDSATLTCKQKPAAVGFLPTWVYPLVGGIVLLILVIVLVLHHQSKYKPLKNYIKTTQSEGYSKDKIRQRLLEEGWEEKDVKKYLK